MGEELGGGVGEVEDDAGHDAEEHDRAGRDGERETGARVDDDAGADRHRLTFGGAYIASTMRR